MSLKFMGKKRGMIQLFDDKGNALLAQSSKQNQTSLRKLKQKKPTVTTPFNWASKESQRSPYYGKACKQSLCGATFKKANVEPRRYLHESRFEKVEGIFIRTRNYR